MKGTFGNILYLLGCLRDYYQKKKFLINLKWSLLSIQTLNI